MIIYKELFFQLEKVQDLANEEQDTGSVGQT